MRILVRTGSGSPEWGGRKKRRRRRVMIAVSFIVLAVAGVSVFIWVAYQRSLEPQITWQSNGGTAAERDVRPPVEPSSFYLG